MPDGAPDLYGAERQAVGVRGSYLAYRSDVFHRGAAFGSAERARFVLALAFKSADQDWIGYDQAQSRSTDRGGPGSPNGALPGSSNCSASRPRATRSGPRPWSTRRPSAIGSWT